MKKSHDQYLILSPSYMKALDLHDSNEMQNLIWPRDMGSKKIGNNMNGSTVDLWQ